jgi:hypothetical protein
MALTQAQRGTLIAVRELLAGVQRASEEAGARLLAAMDETGPDEPPPPDTGKRPEPKPGAVKGKHFTGLAKLEADQDYVDCTFDGLDQKIAKGVRLFGCTFLGKARHPPETHGKHPIYLSGGRNENPSGLRIYDPVWQGCSDGTIEFKLSDVLVVGGKGRCSFRIRHGTRVTIEDCRDVDVITLRGHAHRVVNCPGAKVELFAGDLPAEYKDWGSMHTGPDSPAKMQCCAKSYAAGVGSVLVGRVSMGRDKYKARDNVIHPALRDRTELKAHEGTKFEARD